MGKIRGWLRLSLKAAAPPAKLEVKMAGGGAISYSEEFISPVAAARLFRAMIVEADHLIPQLLPQAVKSIELLQGHGGPGTIKKITLAQGSETKIVIHRVDEVDEEKLKYGYSVIEGVGLGDKVESICYEVKFEGSTNGGTKGTTIARYLPKPGAEVTEEEIRAEEAKAKAIFKVIEAYLIHTNPH
ncbi:major allergen Pru ar 1-like [Momordica charantia]|uniref:Major allergen Pru ar 1-like n=1 Tax=Momordica charantia TaxID=3673 RepID=A0A6J1CC06_MOMCH|nr:major allergen Pru ar 1-like [Momordica charantia]